MASRDKDNREKKPEYSAHLDNNVKDKDNNAYTKQKRKTVERERESEEVVAMTTFGDEDSSISGSIVKEGIDTESTEGNNIDSPPLHKKKVKSRRIKMKQPSKLDINSCNITSSAPLSIYTYEQKVMIDTNKNASMPNNVSYESPSNTIDATQDKHIQEIITEKVTTEKTPPAEKETTSLPDKTNNTTNNSTTPEKATNTRAEDIHPTTNSTNTTNNTTNTTNTINNMPANNTTRTNTITTNANRTLSKSDALPATKTKDGGIGNTQQQDKMQKLAFLTDLYDQGYITVVEYKERKSQIIDELTGTRTRTRTRNNSHVLLPPTVVASPPPDWSTIREETALRHVFDTAKNQWTTTVVKVKLDKDPFACGGLRKCYHLHDCTRPEDNYVAKLSIDPFEDHEIYFIDVEIQMRSKEFAKKFNQYNPPKNVDFVMAWLLELIEREGRPLCGVETFIEGPYRKHNNNFGYVSEDERNTPQAFSHFTYEASNHKILICDIQGVADLYTDPQMHTIDNKKTELMGKGNMGVRGISKFLATHQCNAICRYLRLPSINAKLIDAGTVPAQTYMSYQKVDVVNIECYHPSPHLFGAKVDTSPLLEPAKEANRTCSCTIL